MFIYIVLTVITAPLTVDLLLPSLLEMKSVFAVDDFSINLISSFYLLGFSLGGLFFAPLSDRFGRKSILIVGFFLYALGGWVSVYAESLYEFFQKTEIFTEIFMGREVIDILFFARFLQGIGCVACMSIARAITRDLCDVASLSRVFALQSSAVMGVIIFAPAIGGFVQELWGWRMNLVILCVYGMVMLVLSLFLIETNRFLHKTFNVITLFRGYIKILKQPMFVLYTFLGLLVFSALLSFIFNMPKFLEMLEVDNKYLGGIMLLIGLGFALMAALGSYAGKRIGEENLFLYTMIWSIVISGGHFFYILIGFENIVSFVIFLFFVNGINAILLPIIGARSLYIFKHYVGTAAALNTVIQFGGAFLVIFAMSFVALNTNHVLLVFMGLLFGLYFVTGLTYYYFRYINDLQKEVGL